MCVYIYVCVYIYISNHYIVLLKLIHCRMSIIVQKKKRVGAWQRVGNEGKKANNTEGTEAGTPVPWGGKARGQPCSEAQGWQWCEVGSPRILFLDTEYLALCLNFIRANRSVIPIAWRENRRAVQAQMLMQVSALKERLFRSWTEARPRLPEWAGQKDGGCFFWSLVVSFLLAVVVNVSYPTKVKLLFRRKGAHIWSSVLTLLQMIENFLFLGNFYVAETKAACLIWVLSTIFTVVILKSLN